MNKRGTPSDYEEGKASYIGAASGEAHVQGTGWANPATPLEFGTTGQSRRLEAVRLSVPNQPLPGGITYEVHARGLGWMPAASDGELAGTEGQSRRLEAVRVSSMQACPYASGMSPQPSQPTGSAPTTPSVTMPSRAFVVFVSLMVSPLGS